MRSRQPYRLGRRQWMMGTFAALGAAGCHSPLVNFRSQSPEPDQPEVFQEPESLARLVREFASPSGLNLVNVESVALCLDLDGTGSDPPRSAHRDALVDEMETHEAYDPAEILARDDTSLVMLRALLPPGVHKDDRVDVEVTLPRGSKTTSLRGGWLMLSRMREHLYVPGSMRTGNVAALAQGPVLVDGVFIDDDSQELETRGRVLGGARVMNSRSFGLVMKEDHASGAKSALLATAINARFNQHKSGAREGVASPKNKQFIELLLPPRYKNNAGRYLRVVRNIAVGESPIALGERLQILEKMLMDPAFTEVAALRLEAIGDDAIPFLRKGLSSTEARVRFAAAEALAYMDDADAAPILGNAAEHERAWRWRALTALAAMDHVAALDALTHLLSVSSSEARYGAFVAMRVRNPRDTFVAGEVFNESFAFHRLEAGGEPMIHFSTRRRAELVLLGGEQTLEPPAFLFAGKHILIKGMPNGRLRVTRMAATESDDRVIMVEPEVSRLVRAITDLGGGYAEVYQALRDAKQNGYLSSKFVVDATPQAGRIRQEASPSNEPDGAVPDLFADGLTSSRRQSSSDLEEINPVDEEPTPQKGFLRRWKGE